MIPSETTNERHALCDLCFRYCDDAGLPLEPQPDRSVQANWARACAITAIVCEKCKVNPPAPEPAPARPIPAPHKPAVHEKVCPSTKRRKSPATPPACIAPRGCPQERDLPEPVHEMTDRQYHEAFINSATCSDGVKRVMRLLMQGFDGTRPGQWHSGTEIQEKCGIKAMNSTAPRLRDQVESQGWDIDSHVIPGGKLNHWAYRICRREDSERLKRNEQRDKDTNQTEFETGARNN